MNKIGQQEILTILKRNPNRTYSAPQISTILKTTYKYTHSLLRQMEKYNTIKITYEDGTKMYKLKDKTEDSVKNIMAEVLAIQDSHNPRIGFSEALQILSILENRRKENGKKVIRK